jgi:hypothetical protein
MTILSRKCDSPLCRFPTKRLMPNGMEPLVLTNNVQATRYGLIEAVRPNFGRMFHAARVKTRYPASSKRHAGILALRCLFAKGWTCLAGRV